MPELLEEVVAINHWVGGVSRGVVAERTSKVWNPGTGRQIGAVNLASVAEVDHAVAVAKEAFVEWRKSALSRRTEILFKLRNLIDANRERLATIISTENGKTLADARGEVARGLENVEFACGVPSLLKGATRSR